MDVLVYRIDNLATVRISSRGNIGALYEDYCSRFKGEDDKLRAVDYSFSDRGTLSLRNKEAAEGVICEEYKVEAKSSVPFAPVIFETPNYFFDVEFDEKSGVTPGSMSVKHHLEDVVGRFYSRGLNLSGQLSFVNEPGRFRFEVVYEKGTWHSFWIEFMVTSTKLDVVTDYRTILGVVQKESHDQVFSAYAKTVHDAAVEKRARQAGDWSWVVYFETAFDEYEQALKRILYQPHQQMIYSPCDNRPDCVKRWTPSLAREYARFKSDKAKLERHRFNDSIAESTYDTPENRFVKMTLGKMREWLVGAAAKVSDDGQYAKEFKKSVADRAGRFARYMHEPLMRRISDLRGGSGPSLVLQMRPGYAQIRIVWELMHSLFTTDSSMGQKYALGFSSLAALYEFWCFITMRDILKDVLAHAEAIPINDKGTPVGKLLEQTFVNEDESSRVETVGYRYMKEEKTVAELLFQQSYGPNSSNNLYAGPFCQRPDIVLLVYAGTHVYTYLFDAKYQIENSTYTRQKDAAPRTALDQMHRYRDAILYRQQKSVKEDDGGDKYQREVVGAYILYPGDENRSDELFSYSKYLLEQNIGAFPLLPERTSSLSTHLKEQIFDRIWRDTEDLRWLISDAHAQHGLSLVAGDSGIGANDILTVNLENNDPVEERLLYDGKSLVLRGNEVGSRSRSIRFVRFRSVSHPDIIYELKKDNPSVDKATGDVTYDVVRRLPDTK